ncbi:hypothetical protein D3C87_1537690 [compost metagenome]
MPCLVEEYTCENSSKINSRSSAAIPIPVSSTCTFRTACFLPCETRFTFKVTLPLIVNLIALVNKFITNCFKRKRSPINSTSFSNEILFSSSRFLFTASTFILLNTSMISSTGKNGVFSRFIFPTSYLEKSRISLTKANNISEELRIALT